MNNKLLMVILRNQNAPIEGNLGSQRSNQIKPRLPPLGGHVVRDIVWTGVVILVVGLFGVL
jgi:hypothetical protein